MKITVPEATFSEQAPLFIDGREYLDRMPLLYLGYEVAGDTFVFIKHALFHASSVASDA
jgi:hypothetical protein